MPWCPKCKNEYKKGFLICSDCDVSLVENYEDLFAEDEIKNFENEISIETIDFENEQLEEPFEEIRSLYQKSDVRMFEKREDKAIEYETSASVLILVGGLGMITLLLIHFNIIPIQLGNPFLMNTIMGILFVIFISLGISSLKTSKKFDDDADVENKIEDDVIAYCEQHITKEMVDNIAMEEELDGIQYFQRVDFIKSIIEEEHADLNEDFIEYIADVYYQQLYGKQ